MAPGMTELAAGAELDQATPSPLARSSGPLFYPPHELLQDHYEGVAKQAAEVAERLQGIGVSSDGRANTIVRTSRCAR